VLIQVQLQDNLYKRSYFRGGRGQLFKSMIKARRKQSAPAPSVRTFRPELPKGVDRTIQRAMALRPEDRFVSAGQFVEELDRALRFRAGDGKRWWQFWR
jgi:hypothetical protein